MMERNYQLVAWTKNITDKEDARLYMTPSLECEVQADLVTDLTFIHREEYKFDGPVSPDLARRAVLAYERMSRFEILTGHFGDGIRYLFFGAKYCIWEDDFCVGLRHEFIRLCEEGIRLAKKFRREDVLQECKPKQMLEIYPDQTAHPRSHQARYHEKPQNTEFLNTSVNTIYTYSTKMRYDSIAGPDKFEENVKNIDYIKL